MVEVGDVVLWQGDKLAKVQQVYAHPREGHSGVMLILPKGWTQTVLVTFSEVELTTIQY